LHLLPHINAPAADLPVKKVIGGKHFLADITLPYGQVLHDYIAERDSGKVFKSEPGRLSREKILNMCAMPAPAASYGKGPVSLNNREYFIIKYETDPEALRNYLPDCLFANKENIVVAQWINTHGTGLGNYSKFEMFIPCEDEHGNAYNFGVYSFVNSSAAITAGREVWGEPHKFGDPIFEVNKDTINGHLNYAQLKVASGTMPYKHKSVDINQAVHWMTTPHINLKLIPNVRGDAEIAQLVVLEHSKIRVHSAWEGPARLELIPHANAPVADLPVKRLLGGMDIVVDLTLPEGHVFKDYLEEEQQKTL
jgi:acetoacetate decarboxylase